MPVYATGPGSYLFSGTVEQSYIPHAMAYAACISQDNSHCEQPPSDDACAPPPLPIHIPVQPIHTPVQPLQPIEQREPMEPLYTLQHPPPKPPDPAPVEERKRPRDQWSWNSSSAGLVWKNHLLLIPSLCIIIFLIT